MKMKLLGLVLAALVAAPVAAQVKTVPKDVLVWYADVMDMYVGLTKGIDKATNAKAASAAFDTATAAIVSKKLAARYHTLEAQYPHFFESEDNVDSTWVPPPEWMKVVQDYGTAMQTYGMGMQKVMNWYTDPGLAASLEKFSEAAGEIGSEE